MARARKAGDRQGRGQLELRRHDVGILDAGILDAGILDAGILDAGILDAGILDAGILDAGILDGSILDGSILDESILVPRAARQPPPRADPSFLQELDSWTLQPISS